MTIKAIVHPAEEGGFWAEVPALPGCFTQGESLEEVHENLKEAVAGWFEAGDFTGEIAKEDRILELSLRNRSPGDSLPKLSRNAVGAFAASMAVTTFSR